MPVFTDQLGRPVNISVPPRCIVSLVPSQTELLAALELDDVVKGITKFCVHPESWFRNKTRVGGTKNVKPEVIDALQPDLIIANKEENTAEQIQLLAARYPVWVSNVHALPDAVDMIFAVGEMTDRLTVATAIIANIQEGFSLLSPPSQQRLRTAYLIWKDPWMTVGYDTFIHDMLTRCGFENVFAHLARYPAITLEDLKTSNCELLLLSSEPYPFKQQHVEALQKELPNTLILLVDGEYFSWYGSRLQEAPRYFSKLIGEIVKQQP